MGAWCNRCGEEIWGIGDCPNCTDNDRGKQAAVSSGDSLCIIDWLDALRAISESVELQCQRAQEDGYYDLLTDLSNIKRNLKNLRRQMEGASKTESSTTPGQQTAATNRNEVGDEDMKTRKTNKRDSKPSAALARSSMQRMARPRRWTWREVATEMLQWGDRMRAQLEEQGAYSEGWDHVSKWAHDRMKKRPSNPSSATSTGTQCPQ